MTAMPQYPDFQPNLRFLPTLAISPDGSQLAYVDDSSGQFNVTVRHLENGHRRLTDYVDSAVRRVAWHPDGQSLIFLADAKGDENAQLYLVPAEGGRPEPLTHSPHAQYTAALGEPFSPDGSRLAYTGNDRAAADQDVLVREMETGRVTRARAGGGRTYAGYWAPDGSRLTATEWRVTNSDHVVYVIPVDGSAPLRLTSLEGASCYWLGPWLPDGSGFLVISNDGKEFEGLAVMDASTGDLSWLDTPEWNIDEVALSADGRVLIWNVNVDGASQLRARDFTTGEELAVPRLPVGTATGLTISADGRLAVLRLSTPTQPWNIMAIDLAEGSLRRLTTAAPVAADPANFIEPELVRYPSRDGRQIPAYLYRPAGSGRPTGVLLSIHGGPSWQERPAYLYDGFYQFLLSRGIAVLAPNVRGSLGYGREYEALINRDWGGGDLADLAAAVAYLQEQPWVDAHRIGVFGASYGGFAALSCLSRLPELNWAAGVDFYGPSNLVTLAKASPPTWRSLIAAMFGDPDADADFLMSRSPVTYADQIRAPLLVVQGANDPRVPPAESEQIVQRLREQGVKVRYELFPDEGHGFTKRENQASAFAQAGEFLTRYLGP